MISRQRRALWRTVRAAEFAVLAVQQAGMSPEATAAACQK
jgi:hypothetical protein